LEQGSSRSARSAVIAALLRHGRLSRSELAVLTELSRASITDVTQQLLAQGLLLELPVAQLEARRGRPAILLSLHAAHACFVGINIADTATAIVLTDLQGRILARQPMPAYKTPAELVAAVRKGYQQLLRGTGTPRTRVRGVGLTVTGIVDHGEGVCRYSAALDWRDVPISKMIGKAMQLPAWVDNDAKAVAVGEKFFGRARGYMHFTSVVLGRTIGAAHYMNGALYRGQDGGAGEIAHITVDPNGMLCRCGRNGCLDTISGGAALQLTAQELGLQINSMRDLESLAMHGSTVATRLLRNAGKTLGSVIASLIQINNPQCILFTDMEGFGNGVFRTATRQAIENGILPRFLAGTGILFNEVEADFLPRSAASIAAFEYLRTIR
jgi:predicted NBD/HSP70 family sugar kinase